MASLNKVMLIGNLGRDPEVRYMPSGDPIATLSLATTSVWNDRSSGQRQEATEWHRVVFFGRQAEVCQQYLKKGSSVYVEGKITTRKWTDQAGVERYSTEIRGDVMQMLGGRTQGAATQVPAMEDIPPPFDAEGASSAHAVPQPPKRQESPPAVMPVTDLDDDIPF